MYITLAFLVCLTVNAQVDRSIRPISKDIPTVKIGGTQSFTLKNGLKVMVLEDHKLPKIDLGLKIHYPTAEGNKKGVMGLLSSMLGNATKSMKKDVLQENIDFMGSSLNFSSDGFSASFLSRYLPEMMEIIKSIMFESVFTEEEFKKEQSKLLEYLKAMEKDIDFINSRVHGVLLFGAKHPYGEFTSEESVQRVTLADVKKAFKERFNPKTSYLWVHGDVRFKDIKKRIEKIFSQWEGREPKKFTFPKVPEIKENTIAFVDMPDAVQSIVQVSSTVDIKRNSPDYFAAILANHILGGGANGKLFLNLREDKAWTYGASSSLSPDFFNLGSFRAFAKVRNAVTDSAVVEMIKEVNLICDKPVTKEALELAKSEYVGTFVMKAKDSRLDFVVNTEMFNLSPTHYRDFIKNIRAVTLEDVQRVAKKYFKPKHLKILVVGKGADVLENLEKLPYPIAYFDQYGKPIKRPSFSKPIPKGITKKKVLDKYFKAIGGLEKVKKVKTVYVVEKFSQQGMPIEIHKKYMQPTKFSLEVLVMGGVVQKMVFDGKKGYSKGQDGIKKPVDEKTIKMLKKGKGDNVYFSVLAYYKTGTLKAIEKINGKELYVIAEEKSKSYFDVATGFLVQKEITFLNQEGKESVMKYVYSDYKKAGDFILPYTIKDDMQTSKVEHFYFNEKVSAKDFK